MQGCLIVPISGNRRLSPAQNIRDNEPKIKYIGKIVRDMFRNERIRIKEPSKAIERAMK